MSNLSQTVGAALTKAGVKAFGFTIPTLAQTWTTSTTVTVQENNLSLSLSAGTWLSPIAGTLHRVESDMPVTLIRADGNFQSGPGFLLTLFPQAWLRLCRLYAQELEKPSTTRKERDSGLPFRPVPRYFFFAGDIGDAKAKPSGWVSPGDDLEVGGEMTAYDNSGMPIDPLAVASAFQAFLKKRSALKLDSSDSKNLESIVNLATDTSVRIRVSEHSGAPYDNSGSKLTGITNVETKSGLYKLDSGLSGKVELKAGTGKTGAFPDEERRLIAIGPATTGRLGDSFTPPQTPDGVTIKRDFFSLRVVQLKTFLLGTPNKNFKPHTKDSLEKPPPVRVHQPLSFLIDGNDVLATTAAALSGTLQESIAVAQSINSAFNVPTEAGDKAHWPQFPAASGSPATEKPAVKLRDGFTPKAEFFDDGKGNPKIDVVLALHGLPKGAAVRIYPRKFIEDAQEARGDGIGRVVPDSGELVVLLKDPLGLTPSDPKMKITVPEKAVLRVDLMIVLRNGEKRLYGNVWTDIETTTTTSPPFSESNSFDKAAHRSVSNAGVLGLGTFSGKPPDDQLQAVLALTGEAQPRDASRWPTMARRELIVAGRSSDKWRAVLSAGRLAPETHSAGSRIGSPGGLGGRETQVVGVSSQNSRLAYDIARMGFRRAKDIIQRLIALADGKWDQPAEPSALKPGDPITADVGTIAGAILQTIAPYAETPEIQMLHEFVDSLPDTFDALVDWVGTKLVPGSIPRRTDIINALNNLKGNAKGERLFDELHREIMSSTYGRRDAQWALNSAIQNARNFIYIESPGFAPTQKDYSGGTPPAYAVDLISALRQRLQSASGLRVMICTPKYADFAAGYEPLAAVEVADRKTAIESLQSETDAEKRRVLAFHPIGFPGRFTRLESTVVIVDDVWALVGSSTFRRRGLTFDGGSDLVFTDMDIVNGRCKMIANFRRALMASRLGISAAQGTPDPSFVRLGDGVEAFYVIRDLLAAGGLGKIAPLWDGVTPWVDPLNPKGIPFELVSPEGQEFADGSDSRWFLAALGLAGLADRNAF